MQEATKEQHDKLISEHATAIHRALLDNPNTRQVAKQIGVPATVVAHVKRQLPDSVLRAKHASKRLTYAEADIPQALRRVHEKVCEPGEVLTEAAYGKHRRRSEPSLSRVTQIHGRWNAALAAAGLPVNPSSGERRQYTADDCLTALAACATELGKAPSYPQYDAWARHREGAPSAGTVRNRMGRWLEALAAVGL